MTPEQLKSKFPHASASFIRINNSRLHTPEPERPKKRALERPVSREEESPVRLEICFRIYATRACDWDNYRTKDLQDALIIAGLLPDDNWRTLQGRVESHQVQTKAEERTEVSVVLVV